MIYITILYLLEFKLTQLLSMLQRGVINFDAARHTCEFINTLFFGKTDNGTAERIDVVFFSSID